MFIGALGLNPIWFLSGSHPLPVSFLYHMAMWAFLWTSIGPTGTEILKNLVLPGVGSFVVIDGNVVTERDLQNNFFVDEESLGQPRSKVVRAKSIQVSEDNRFNAI